MSILVAINHKTEYRFDRLVALSPHVVRLRPAAHCRTPIRAYSLKIEPQEHFLNWQQDPFGNYLARLVFPEKTRKLTVEVDVIAEMITINPFDFFLEEYAYNFPFKYDPQLVKELAPYMEIKEDGPLLKEWLAGVDRTPRETVYFLVDLNQRLQQSIGYVIRMEPGIQTCEESLGLAKGSCRDSAWVLVQILRHLGFAARFVSGYLVQLTADVKSLDGPSGPEKDFTDLHAWTEVYCPGAGWIGLDPTSGLFAGEGHIPLACSPDPLSAAPITGAMDKCEVEFYFHNEVRRIHEDPRVTKPYTDEQWAAIEDLGHKVDAELKANDVRLTMGGEPTFVSIDDMDGAEWNIAALGPTKKILAEDLVLRLKGRFAPGGLLHIGQGKWYPGEQLPRWALSCYWRKDGQPVWRDPSLLGQENTSYGHGPAEAETFIRTLAKHLGVDPAFAEPAYEDVWYYLWKEQRLPVNVDPLDNKLKDPNERKRIARLFDQGLNRTAGYTLPLRWWGFGDQGGWKSGKWTFRDGRLFLIPGDSPMGFRLPLDSLPYLPESELDQVPERNPFEPVAPLRSPFDEVSRRYSRLVEPAQRPQQIREQGVASRDIAARYGRLTPVDDSHQATPFPGRPARRPAPGPGAHRALHRAAGGPALLFHAAAHPPGALAGPGHVPGRHGRRAQDAHRHRGLRAAARPSAPEARGHPGPRRHRGQHPPLRVLGRDGARHPHPLRGGAARPARHREVHARRAPHRHRRRQPCDPGRPHPGRQPAAAPARSGAEPDHLLAAPPEPVLSLLRDVHRTHQPGPTGGRGARRPALRARHRLPADARRARSPQPWIVDRVLRNLLTDVTGNTHRTEFCIDKLYSPDSASGRQGLVEFRAFEMPPHARMSLAQLALLRTLVARFWKQPYTRKPVRWGTELHDRFLLPHFVRQDFEDVICDLRRAGYPFEPAWFDPFFEFRFPHYGDLVTDNGIHMELRAAIEPWHVLGEEVTAQGTSRFVDSSVERMQVKVNGMVGDRHVLACNGRRVPLRPTGKRAEFVAGIRFKAWSPPSGLHPTIPPHSPLVFEVVDTWNRQSLGGCTYYVAHPGGRSESNFPVNAYEAESRRIARFRLMGHTPGPMDAPAEEPAGEHPYTLDLRYRAGC